MTRRPPPALHPGLPAREEPAEVLGVHGLLDEQVDLAADAEHRPLLHPLQLLLQPQQHPLRHFVEALAVAAGGRDRDGMGGHIRPVLKSRRWLPVPLVLKSVVA